MSFRTTRRCDHDIVAIYRHGATRFGRAQAERYHADLVATFELLAANPLIARLRDEFHPPVRLHPYGAHMIAYVETQEGILVVRVLHGRQDWRRHL